VSLSNFKLLLALTSLRTYKEKLFYSKGHPTWSGYMLDCAISRCRYSSRSCLTDPIAPCDEMTELVAMERAVGVVYLGF